MQNNKPTYRVLIKRKDKKPITVPGRDGTPVEVTSARLGSLWPNRFGGFNLQVELAGHSIDPETFYYNVVEVNDRPRNDDPFKV